MRIVPYPARQIDEIVETSYFSQLELYIMVLKD